MANYMTARQRRQNANQRNNRLHRLMVRTGYIYDWPIYLVVRRGYVGFYNNMYDVFIHNDGIDYHCCTKYNFLEALEDAQEYYNFHFQDRDDVINIDFIENNMVMNMLFEVHPRRAAYGVVCS